MGGTLGYDIPALPGMAEADIVTPCLILDLDALERNIRRLGEEVRRLGVRHRAHGKMHKSIDVLKLQEALGGACGVCCQKVSEAEAFARAGARDILISNQVVGDTKLERLAALPRFGARIAVCVDDAMNVADLSAAAVAAETDLDVLVEIECGAGRCGVGSPDAAIALAQAIIASPGLRFEGLQAYNGAMQHIEDEAARAERADAVIETVRRYLAALEAEGLTCRTVTGGGTGSWRREAASGVYTEVQCGSYAFMDAHYGRVLCDEWETALFVLTSVMSVARPGQAVVDAGHKAHAVDSGPPRVHDRQDLDYVGWSDEHGIVADPDRTLRLGDRLRLVPGHCDPTCNLHDCYVGLRGGTVESVWPVTARGKLF
ncbi:DSD1 family PLP-dependent enzyme [Jannaschia aquimarina]|uniref:Dhaa protein n=1 Tax=Jannaschia aquimarina TaxID=935700 RepID=A0A0D1CQ50_9RHOB|nr:DSD1 family PLP-dependent enzyme [Jannaschia aquimarina]KIT16867.1 3-hydroxy-D-aspartate aldolase [Jannaschia aquimarina]SNT12723.1 D-3-hydroxyaspartate aldolase [Jannaschia aquimarina]